MNISGEKLRLTKQLQNAKWQVIAVVYVPLIFFLIGIATGNFGATLLMGRFLILVTIGLCAAIVLNAFMGLLKSRDSFVALPYHLLQSISNDMFLLFFLLVLGGRLRTAPTQTVVLFLLLLVFLAFATALIEHAAKEAFVYNVFAGKYLIQDGLEHIKLVCVFVTLAIMYVRNSSWIESFVAEIMYWLMPTITGRGLELTSIIFALILAALFFLLFNLIFREFIDFFKYCLKRPKLKTYIVLAIVCAQLSFAALAILF